MGWGDCGTDSKGRPIGYAFAATCDLEGCEGQIDRGLSYACGGMHGESPGCELYFCEEHLHLPDVCDAFEKLLEGDGLQGGVCPACRKLLEEQEVEWLRERYEELTAQPTPQWTAVYPTEPGWYWMAVPHESEADPRGLYWSRMCVEFSEVGKDDLVSNPTGSLTWCFEEHACHHWPWELEHGTLFLGPLRDMPALPSEPPLNKAELYARCPIDHPTSKLPEEFPRKELS